MCLFILVLYFWGQSCLNITLDLTLVPKKRTHITINSSHTCRLTDPISLYFLSQNTMWSVLYCSNEICNLIVTDISAETGAFSMITIHPHNLDIIISVLYVSVLMIRCMNIISTNKHSGFFRQMKKTIYCFKRYYSKAASHSKWYKWCRNE